MNVVFDLGGVVVAWRPDEIVAAAVDDPALRTIARREIIGHADWLELDRGSLTVEEAIARGVERSRLPEPLVRRLITSVPASLVPNPETVDLLHRVKAAGNELFVLSNMPHDSMAHLETEYDFWHLFTGTVVSARVGHIKPEPGIYRHLLDTYGLEAVETVFIDDMPPNLEAAARFGIRTIRFETAAQAEAELRALGCLPRHEPVR
jgi:putative hydrolase of the HAD superfamily